jgi:hypothetical protein
MHRSAIASRTLFRKSTELAAFVQGRMVGMIIERSGVGRSSGAEVRFSLRSLLTATALIAVALGAVVWFTGAIGQAQRDARDSAIRAGRIPPD